MRSRTFITTCPSAVVLPHGTTLPSSTLQRAISLMMKPSDVCKRAQCTESL